jgi:hypothetical protein
MRELLARFGTGFTSQISLISKMGKKGITFGLGIGFETREHGNQNDRKKSCTDPNLLDFEQSI